MIKVDDHKKSHDSLDRAEENALMSSGVPEFDNDVTRPNQSIVPRIGDSARNQTDRAAESNRLN